MTKCLAPSGYSGPIRNFCPCRCLVALDQSFSASARLTPELTILCGGHWLYRMSSSILGLYPLNASWNNHRCPQTLLTVPRECKISPLYHLDENSCSSHTHSPIHWKWHRDCSHLNAVCIFSPCSRPRQGCLLACHLPVPGWRWRLLRIGTQLTISAHNDLNRSALIAWDQVSSGVISFRAPVAVYLYSSQ